MSFFKFSFKFSQTYIEVWYDTMFIGKILVCRDTHTLCVLSCLQGRNEERERESFDFVTPFYILLWSGHLAAFRSFIWKSRDVTPTDVILILLWIFYVKPRGRIYEKMSRSNQGLLKADPWEWIKFWLGDEKHKGHQGGTNLLVCINKPLYDRRTKISGSCRLVARGTPCRIDDWLWWPQVMCYSNAIRSKHIDHLN